MKTSPVEKLFYGRYPFKITFNKNGPELDPVLDEIRAQFQNTNTKRFRKRQEINLSLYFHDRFDYEFFKKKFNHQIDEAFETADDDLELLKKDSTIRFRTSFYFGVFRYKLVFNHFWNETNFDEIMGFLERFYQRKERWKDYLWYNTSSTQMPVLYLNDKDDLVLITLALKEYIQSRCEVMIIDNKKKEGNSHDAGTSSEFDSEERDSNND